MARTTVDVQLAKIRQQVETLHAKEKLLLSKANDKVIAQIVALAKQHGITHDELGEAMGLAKSKRLGKDAGQAQKASRKPAKSSDKRGKVAPKYRNPSDTAQTWTGRGISPAWIKVLKETGALETALIAA